MSEEFIQAKYPNGLTEAERKKPLVLKDFMAFEDTGNFDRSPLGFEETAASLRQDLDELMYFCCVLNRYSLDYLEHCAKLEEAIKRMASLCVTRAALEQMGLSFIHLNGLKLETLIEMVSYHFRKCHSAVQGAKHDDMIYAQRAFIMECRWAGLLQRLDATDKRINLIREGKIRAESLINPHMAKEEEKHNTPSGYLQCLADDDRLFPIGSPQAFQARQDFIIAASMEMQRREEMKQKAAAAAADKSKAEPKDKAASAGKKECPAAPEAEKEIRETDTPDVSGEQQPAEEKPTRQKANKPIRHIPAAQRPEEEESFFKAWVTYLSGLPDLEDD